MSNVTHTLSATLKPQRDAYALLAFVGALTSRHALSAAAGDPVLRGYLHYLLHYELAELPSFVGSAAEAQVFECNNTEALHPLTVDASESLIPALLSAITQRLAAGESIEGLSFAVASWLRFSMGFDGKGDTINVQDPLAQRLMQVRLQYWDHIDELVEQYLQVEPLFSVQLRQSRVFRERLTYWLSYILANGVVTAIQTLLLEVQDYSAAPRLAGSAK